MKRRRNYDMNPKDPSPIRTSFPAAPRGVRGPETRPDQAADSKTSEFAFYNKLKEDAGQGQRFDFHSMQREKKQSTKLNSSKCDGTKVLVGEASTSLEGTDITRNHSEDFRSPWSVRNISFKELGSLCSIEDVGSKDSKLPFPINGVTHINFDSFISPVDKAANNSEFSLNKAFSAFEYPCCIEDWLEHDSDGKRPGGSKSDQAEFFSKKRQKLRQWAHNSFPEIEELCAKGYDLVSMLLSRLLPWSNEKKGFRTGESALVESNSNPELLVCSKSEIPAKEHYGMPTSNIMEIEYMPYLENGILSCCSDRLRETMLSKFCSPTKNYSSTIQNNLELPICEGGENLMSCMGGDSYFGFPFVKHGSYMPFIPFREPDDSDDLHGSLPERESHMLLLEWDSVNMNERSSLATCQNTDWTIVPAVRSSWDHWKSTKNWSESYGTLGASSSPVLSSHLLQSYTLTSPSGSSNEKSEHGRSKLEEDEKMLADFSHLPLTLSNSSECLNLNGDCDYYEIACRGSETSDILPFSGNQLGFTSKAFGEENSTHLSFALGLEWKCLQSTCLRREQLSSTCIDLQFREKEIMYRNFLRKDGFKSSSGGSGYRNLIQTTEDIIDMHDWGSICFQMFHDKDKAYPLLLDKSSWEDCTEETYDGNDQVKCL